MLVSTLFSIHLVFSGCAATNATDSIKPIPYDLERPFAYFDLPVELMEISGLSTTTDPQRLAAVNDERGTLYYIDKNNGKVTPSVSFTPDGDFEGLEMIKDTLWVVKSNGKLYKIWHLNKAKPDTMTFKTGLKKEDNIEGLTYDPLSKRLILCSKGYKESDFKKEFYAFDTQTKAFTKIFDVGLADFQAFLEKNKQKRYDKMREDYVTNTEKLRGFEFGPSGIAIHPVSKNFYVISSINKLLVVLTPEGKVLDIIKLGKERHRQPEGICFDTDGTMYISNEAKDGLPAQLFVFKMK